MPKFKIEVMTVQGYMLARSASHHLIEGKTLHAIIVRSTPGFIRQLRLRVKTWWLLRKMVKKMLAGFDHGGLELKMTKPKMGPFTQVYPPGVPSSESDAN